MTSRHVFAAVCLAGALAAAPARAQEMPADYKGVLESLGRPGDYGDGVLKVNIPRTDLRVVVDGVATPTPFGFGGWIAFTRGDDGHDVMMGDLVLTEEEVNPVMSAVLDNGLDVTALHNHFFFETPRMFYMHVHGTARWRISRGGFARRSNLIGKTPRQREATAGTNAGRTLEGPLDTTRLAAIIGHDGEQNGPVYKITIGRPDIPLKERGAAINARMGLNTWAAFYGGDAEAVVAGDVAMLAPEVTPVLRALRDNGIDIVAIHHHMTGTEPTVIFLHYWGRGPAAELAKAVRAAMDHTGHRRSGAR